MLQDFSSFVSIKGTVRVLSNDFPSIVWHVGFTTIPPLVDQGFLKYYCLYSGKLSTKNLRECTLAQRETCTLTKVPL